jgi:hypothetical protein
VELANAIELVAAHPAAARVELAGSRSRGTHAELSDWDLAVTTIDFAALASDLPALVAPLGAVGEQWEPMGHFPVYQLLLRGPEKLEYLFLDQRQLAMAPPTSPAAIDTHFWDWTWWLATKASIGRDDLVAEHLPQLHTHLLRPLGVAEVPAGIEAAIAAYLARRGAPVSRALEDEVRHGIRRIGISGE